MIKVKIGNNTHHPEKIFSIDTTLRQAFEQAGVDYSMGVNNLDGSMLSAGELDKTFEDFGFDGSEGHDKCFLISVIKADNA